MEGSVLKKQKNTKRQYKERGLLYIRREQVEQQNSRRGLTLKLMEDNLLEINKNLL